MQLTREIVLLSALTVHATPVLEDLDKRGGYTCQQAYNDCQGSGKGKYVCWADDEK
jgi:hypothetical protein